MTPNYRRRGAAVVLALGVLSACIADEPAPDAIATTTPSVSAPTDVPQSTIPPAAPDSDVAPGVIDSVRANAPWEAARLRGVDFRGLGQEPGWFVEISVGDSIVFHGDYGETLATTPAPPSVVDSASGRTVYRARTEAHDLTVTIEARPCNDAMSGLPFEATVTVVLNGREYRGCGRSQGSR